MGRLENALAKIDAANADDPNVVVVGAGERPAALLYGERMSAALARLYPDASEALKIAVRAQHIRRWTVPRSDYAMDRGGYLRWRNDLKRKHAEWTGAILGACGYSESEIARVGALIRKENLKQDAEVQALEDVACIVFLENYVEDFARKHDEAKLAGILEKTWAKMSDAGRRAALALDLSPRLRRLIAEATAATPVAGGKEP
jgi:hypothetical protein